MQSSKTKQVDALLTVELQNALEEGVEAQRQGESEKLDECEEPPSSKSHAPSYGEFVEWAERAYSSCDNTPAEVCIRLVSDEEMLDLNTSYRGKAKTTNVLSFTADLEQELQEAMELKLLGDIVICHNVVLQEAQTQGKRVKDHYAHLVTHGVLHLCGYDHENEEEAVEMELFERKILAAQGIPNPYA